MKFIAKEIGELKRRPNEWKGIKVGVFRVENDIETQIGEYERNYSTLFDSFCYFQKDGKDFALYSPETPLLYSSFGFVAGCIWGDDSTYKIQYLDLSEAEKGIIKRDERFGYIALPENLNLKDAIDMYDYGWDDEEESANYIRINIMQTFDLLTGKIVD